MTLTSLCCSRAHFVTSETSRYSTMGKKHKVPKRAKHKGGSGGRTVKVSKAKTRTRNTSRVESTRKRRPTRAQRSRRVNSSGAYRFIDAPPRKDMKRKSP